MRFWKLCISILYFEISMSNAKRWLIIKKKLFRRLSAIMNEVVERLMNLRCDVKSLSCVCEIMR